MGKSPISMKVRIVFELVLSQMPVEHLRSPICRVIIFLKVFYITNIKENKNSITTKRIKKGFQVKVIHVALMSIFSPSFGTFKFKKP